MEKRALRVFLCYASPDKESVQQLYRRLTEDGVNVWLDVENLIPGQRWQIEIPHAIREAEVVIVCLSNKSINKEGYVQKEIAFALDKSDEKPDESIYIIPLRIEDCLVPERLHQWQWVDLFSEDGYIRLLNGLRKKAKENNATLSPSEATKIDEVKSVAFKREKFGNYSEALKLYRELERLAPQYPGLKQKIKELETNEKRQASEKKVSMGKRRLRKENSMVFGYLAIIFVFGLIVFGFFF